MSTGYDLRSVPMYAKAGLIAEDNYSLTEVLRTLAALVDAAGGAIVVERRHMERALDGYLTVSTDPVSGAMRYERVVAENFK